MSRSSSTSNSSSTPMDDTLQTIDVGRVPINPTPTSSSTPMDATLKATDVCRVPINPTPTSSLTPENKVKTEGREQSTRPLSFEEIDAMTDAELFSSLKRYGPDWWEEAKVISMQRIYTDAGLPFPSEFLPGGSDDSIVPINPTPTSSSTPKVYEFIPTVGRVQSNRKRKKASQTRQACELEHVAIISPQVEIA